MTATLFQGFLQRADFLLELLSRIVVVQERAL